MIFPFNVISVNSIVSDFNKTISKLEQLVAQHNKKIDNHTIKIFDLRTEQAFLADEAKRAKNIASKLGDLLK